jgi:hypothetical protein
MATLQTGGDLMSGSEMLHDCIFENYPTFLSRTSGVICKMYNEINIFRSLNIT